MKSLISQIKSSRSAEAFISNLNYKLIIVSKYDNYDEQYYGVGDEILFKISNFYIIIDYNRVWLVLKHKFNISTEEILDLLNNELKSDKQFTRSYNSDMYGSWLSTH